MGQGIAELTGNTVPYQVGVVGFVVVMLAYSWVGGMRAVALTDVMQGIALLVGILALLVGGLYLAGGLGEVTNPTWRRTSRRRSRSRSRPAPSPGCR